MGDAALCSTFQEAYDLLCRTMDEVEDELTPYPNEPDRWMELPRLFPPQMDRMSSVAGSDVKRFDSLGHVTYVASNGSMEIRSLRIVEGVINVHFTMKGSDGKSVCDICPELEETNL